MNRIGLTHLTILLKNTQKSLFNVMEKQTENYSMHAEEKANRI